jgi:hypothetical protein
MIARLDPTVPAGSRQAVTRLQLGGAGNIDEF